MKKFLVISFLMSSALLFATSMFTTGADDIIGVWLTQDKDGKVEITKRGDKYYGKLIWIENEYEEDGKTIKVDKENPDKDLRNRPVKGIELLKDFVYEGDDEWEDGKIYDPKSGKTYSCIIEKLEGNKLKVTGYIGFSFIGKTVYWTKSK